MKKQVNKKQGLKRYSLIEKNFEVMFPELKGVLLRCQIAIPLHSKSHGSFCQNSGSSSFLF